MKQIAINDLVVKYRAAAAEYTALQDINLTVPAGGTCAIVGPSGCGKSTLLKVLAGIITDYDGKVMIGGQPVSPRRQKIGFIPQNYGLLPWKNVQENIYLGVKIKRTAIDQNALELLMEQLGIAGLARRYPGELSGGQQQRVSLARAFLLQPDVLLMDEPFSALDAITREEIQDVFLAVWQSNAVSTVLVTHYVEEALYLGQKIVILSPQPGRISKVLDNPLFGGKDVRSQPEFFALSRDLKRLIQKEWSGC